jgi:hypothetical protein
VIELEAIRGFFGILIVSTTQSPASWGSRWAVDEGQGVVNYVLAFATDEPLSADADAIFLHASLAGQGHRPVGQLPHDASRIIGHPPASLRRLPRSVRSCRLL